VAHCRLTGDAGPALRSFASLLKAQGPTHWYLSGLKPLGSAAAPLLPLIEPLPAARYEWTRMAAAEAHYWITGSTDRAVPILVELVAPLPVGLQALRALAGAPSAEPPRISASHSAPSLSPRCACSATRLTQKRAIPTTNRARWHGNCSPGRTAVS
jgi:hypothetical protein